MAFVLGRHRSGFVDESSEELNNIIGNVTLSDRFLSTAQQMDLVEPKLPDDIYSNLS